MLKMDSLVIRLVYFCSLYVSFLASHEHDNRPNRLDTDPDMNLMPVTRYRPVYYTAPPMTIRYPMELPMPNQPRGPEDYEYNNYDYEHPGDHSMASSGHADDHSDGITSTEDEHLKSTTYPTEQEYVYTDADTSNAKNEFFMDSAARSPSCHWFALFGSAIALLLL